MKVTKVTKVTKDIEGTIVNQSGIKSGVKSVINEGKIHEKDM